MGALKRGQGGAPFVDAGVKLHCAAAERVEVGVDAHISARELAEVACKINFGYFGEWGRCFAEEVVRWVVVCPGRIFFGKAVGALAFLRFFKSG
jgi:hypothetical protein